MRQIEGRTLTSTIGILPNRGWIYDNHMRVLASNTPAVAIVVNRMEVSKDQLPRLAAALAPVMGVSKQALLAKMTALPGEKQVMVTDKANRAQVAFVSEHQSQLSGVHLLETWTRTYPYGSLAGHVLGYIQPQPADEADRYRAAGYLPSQKVGITGVESEYEHVLAGVPGAKEWKTSIYGVPTEAQPTVPAIPGKSVRLTLDAGLQATAQELVWEQLQRARKTLPGHPTDAEAVLLDTRTGGVLSMVSYPYYDPNWFIDPDAYARHRSYIENTHLTPIIDHVLSSPRYPGSTVKPVNLLAAMATGAIDPNTTLHDSGTLMVGTYKAHDWAPYGHGDVDVAKAIQVSCDTYMYQVGMWMARWRDGPPKGQSVSWWNQRDRIKGLNETFDWEWKFGLGPKTGIDLPGEAVGRFWANDSLRHQIVPYDLIASEAQMAQSHHVPNAGLLYDNAFANIGQMQEFTPMQLAVYAMTLADDGRRLRPHVLDAILSADGTRVERKVEPVVVEQVPVNPSHLKAVKRGMYLAVNVPGGTAYRAFAGASYRAAGKTGTAEVSQWGKKTDISLFVGYAPADKPEVAIAVMVPGGGESSDVAVPLARRLLDAYFAQKTHDSQAPSVSAWRETAAAKGTLSLIHI